MTWAKHDGVRSEAWSASREQSEQPPTRVLQDQATGGRSIGATQPGAAATREMIEASTEKPQTVIRTFPRWLSASR